MRKILLAQETQGLRGFSFEIIKKIINDKGLEKEIQVAKVHAENFEFTLFEDHKDRTEKEIKDRLAEVLGTTWVEEVEKPEAQVKSELIHMIADKLDSELSIAEVKKLLRSLTDVKPESELHNYPSLYPAWRPGTTVKIGEKYQHGGKLYKVVQAHTSQIDWSPEKVPALFTAFTPEGVIAAWKQPAGAQDAYQVGVKVTHKGSTWQNNTANNVWEPGVYGWTKL
jgi:hypothetical protein